MLRRVDAAPLTAPETRRLADLERTIAQGFGTFVAVGAALLEIRERRLYRGTYRTWEDYLQRWDVGKTHAHRTIEASRIVKGMSPIGNVDLPITESQVRELAALPDAGTRVRAWEMAFAEHRGHVTAAQVREAVFVVMEELSPHDGETEEERHGEPAGVLGLPASAVPGVYTVPEWNALSARDREFLLTEHPSQTPATFNRTNEHVEWALWTWNPVTGCLHDCTYCYARDIATRFYAQGFVPAFVPGRLHASRAHRIPAAVATNLGERNVFTCSMADLFGKWVPQAWIDAVFAETVAAQDWNFLYLTKFPQRLAQQDWPDNAWCGTTVDRQNRVRTAERSFAEVTAGVKWLSCEPLLERLTFTSLAMFDWVVIGGASASTQTPAFQPPWEWVEHLIRQAREAGCRVYIKPNLLSRPREYPGWVADEVAAPAPFFPSREPR